MAATAVLVVLAIPLTHIHTADSGVDGLPRSLAVMQTYDRMQAAFPGEQFTGTIVVEGQHVSEPSSHAAAAELRQVARDSDQFEEGVTSEISPNGRSARSTSRSPAPAPTTPRWTRSRTCARTSCPR